MKLHYADASSLCCWLDIISPDVVATEESHTVEEFLAVAFGYVGLNWKDRVVIDKHYFQLTEVDNMKGDAGKLKRYFEQLVKMMVDEDIEMANMEKVLVDAGFTDAKPQTLRELSKFKISI